MHGVYEWRSLEDPTHRDLAEVEILDDGVRASGTQTTSTYTATWELDASSGWVTRSLVVDVQGREGWARSLDLRRDAGSGDWSSTTSTSGGAPGGLRPPGLADGVDLAGALDCDLARCPLTNLMPIRRLGLLSRPVDTQALTVAWVDLPSLAVIASDQYYASGPARRVRYASGTRDVDVELAVDADGVVTHYPDLAVRVAPAAGAALSRRLIRADDRPHRGPETDLGSRRP